MTSGKLAKGDNMAKKKTIGVSLVSISDAEFEEQNQKLFMDSLSKLDPDLWLIKNYLVRNKINPALLPPVIDQLSRIAKGSGYGEVRIVIKEQRVYKCIGQDDRLLDLEIEQ